MGPSVNQKEFPYQELIVNTCVISFVLDEESRIVQGNDQFYEAIGIDSKDQHTRFFSEFLEEKQQWKNCITSIDELENTSKFTFKIFQPSGNPVYLKSNIGRKNNLYYIIAINVTTEATNNEFLQRVNSLAKLGGWTYNPELDSANWTQTVYDILEIPERIEITRNSILEYIHPEDIEFFNETISLFYLNHEAYDVTIKIITHTGRVKWVRVSAQPEVRHDQVVFVYGAIQDVTEQKKQSIALEETKINMELALRAVNSGYFTHDLITDVISYSSSFREKMSFPPSFSEKEFREHIHPEDQDEAYEQHSRELKSDSAYYVNGYRLKSYTGVYKHFEVHGFKVFDHKNRPIKLVGNLIDVEDKYRLNQLQDKHRYHLKTLMENSFVRSIMLDKEWNLLGMDSKTLNLFFNKLGYNPVAKKVNFKSLLTDHDQLKIQIVSRVLEDGREYRNEVYLDLFEEDRTYYDALFKPILDYSNQIDGYVFYFFDLTEQMAVQQELKTYQNKLKSVHHFKNNIITKLGHELKTPLHGLLQTTKMIFKKESTSPEDEELIKAQQESADRLMRTFDNIINSSLYEEDFYAVQDLLDVSLIIQQVCKGATNRARATGIEFECNNFDGPTMVQGDSVFIKQAIENLLDNAFKFTIDGSVSMETNIVNSHAEITIKDTGVGIPRSKLRDIIEPFEQASSGTTRTYEGLGLGLTFAVKYIEGIGGLLHIDSMENKGTVLRIALPLIE